MKKETVIKVIYTLAPVISIGLFLLVWVIAANNNPDFIPTPMDAVARFQLTLEKPISKMSIFGHVWVSLRRVLFAVGAASILGILFGIFLGYNRFFNNFFGPIFEMLRPIPPIAWIPLITLWFGIGEISKILIVFIASFVAIVINTYTGVRMVDSFIIDVGRSFGVDQKRMLPEIILPSALPAIFAGIKTSISAGWMSVLAAEMISSRAGLGFLITRGMDSSDIALIIVGMVMIGIVGALLSLGLTYLEGRLCPWKN